MRCDLGDMSRNLTRLFEYDVFDWAGLVYVYSFGDRVGGCVGVWRYVIGICDVDSFMKWW